MSQMDSSLKSLCRFVDGNFSEKFSDIYPDKQSGSVCEIKGTTIRTWLDNNRVDIRQRSGVDLVFQGNYSYERMPDEIAIADTKDFMPFEGGKNSVHVVINKEGEVHGSVSRGENAMHKPILSIFSE